MDSLSFQRTLVTYGVLIPVVLLLGYFIGAPSGARGYMLIALLFCIMMLPLMMNYHHIALVATWNAAFTLGFLPGLPKVWYVVALFSIVLTMMARIVHRKPLISYKPLSLSMLFFAFTAIMTGMLRGGVGMKALGSQNYGGKAFVYILIAVIGYFALSFVKIPKRRVGICVLVFFITTLTLILSNVVYMMGPNFWFLYLFVPADYAVGQAQADYLYAEVTRLGGVGFALMGVYFYMMVRYGIRGIFDLTHPLRLLTLFLVVVGSMTGGFRSTIILYILIFIFQFFLEKLYRTKYLWMMIAAGIVSLALLYPFVQKLPTSFQRCVSFLPGLKIDLAAKADADASIEWRLKIWSVLWPQVGDYLLLGKGFVYDASDVHLADESVRRGFLQSEDFAVITGDYHSGPLSVVIPLGIWGVIGFVLINVFGIRMLYLQCKYGDPDFQTINRGLLALFAVRVIYFWFFFGAVASDMATFAGILGLSLAINGSPRRQPWVSEEEEEQQDYMELEAAGLTPEPAFKPSSFPLHRFSSDSDTSALPAPARDERGDDSAEK